jgi:hypothetical protein
MGRSVMGLNCGVLQPGVLQPNLADEVIKVATGVYPYFVCIGRQQDQHSCSQRALRVELVEAAIAAHYATVQLTGRSW